MVKNFILIFSSIVFKYRFKYFFQFYSSIVHIHRQIDRSFYQIQIGMFLQATFYKGRRKLVSNSASVHAYVLHVYLTSC